MIAAAQHYTDEQLLELPPDHPHLTDCASCSAALSSIHELAATLTTELAWDAEPVSEFPNPATVSTLRTIATQMDAEDADAERNVSAMLSMPRESWGDALAANPQCRTPGFVRRLIKEIYARVHSQPAVAADLALLGRDVADNVNASQWHGDTIPRLRGAIWRESAYVLQYLGRHLEALAAADRARAHFAEVAIADFDLARLTLVRAIILRELERFEDALAASKEAAATFSRFGDEERYVSAVTFEAAIAYSVRDYPRAAPLFERFRSHALASGNKRALAMAHQNAAVCYRELRKPDLALEAFGAAVRLFDELGMASERVRATWHVGRVLLAEAKYTEAASILRGVKDTYERLQSYDNAAVVAIDVAEASLMMGRLADVFEACHAAITYYERSGLSYSVNALTALSFMREAAAVGELTSTSVSRVRSYLERLPQQPALLFVPLEK